MTERDAEWLNRLFNDETVIRKLEGVNLFNQSIDRTRSFIKSFNKSSDIGIGMLWAIESQNMPIGFISIFDLSENPFFSYALFPQFRHKGLFKDVLTQINQSLDI